jgi:hypothetical protein
MRAWLGPVIELAVEPDRGRQFAGASTRAREMTEGGMPVIPVAVSVDALRSLRSLRQQVVDADGDGDDGLPGGRWGWR